MSLNKVPQSNDILIIDDSTVDLKLISSILTEAGYSVRPATSATLALRSIQARHPELIIMDVKMPIMDGFGLCQRLKSDDKTALIPIIFCSALGDGPNIRKGFQAGAVDYISKPFQSEEIIARVNIHLKLSRMHIDLEEKVKERTRALKEEIEVRKKSEAEREKLIADLKDALGKVKTLSGLLPICSYCKKIRDDQGYWNQIEHYIRDHSEAKFSHSICQECAKKYHPDYDVYNE